MTRKTAIVAILILAAAGAPTAHAALGAPATSVDSDQAAMKGAKRTSRQSSSGYTVHEFQVNMVTVREYVSPSGTVFAVAWDGNGNPDVAQLLGTHFGEYSQKAAQTRRKGSRRNVTVKGDDLVVERGGHMRHFAGRAYLRSLLPPGVAIDEIR